nr:hypothetical protein [Pandoravirus aubagnensis]
MPCVASKPYISIFSLVVAAAWSHSCLDAQTGESNAAYCSKVTTPKIRRKKNEGCKTQALTRPRAMAPNGNAQRDREMTRRDRSRPDRSDASHVADEYIVALCTLFGRRLLLMMLFCHAPEAFALAEMARWLPRLCWAQTRRRNRRIN